MANLKSKLVVGAGDFLEIAFHAWKEKDPAIAVEKLEITQDEYHSFDLGFLDGYLPEETSMFAAFDNRFLNFKRLELMGAIKSRGFCMDAFIGGGAIVGAGVKIGENSFVSEGAVIGAAAILQYNIYLGARAVVGYAAQIGHSAWIEAAVVLGRRARIGTHTTLGLGVSVTDNIQVGRMCLIEDPGQYCENIPAKTFCKPSFEGPIRIFN